MVILVDHALSFFIGLLSLMRHLRALATQYSSLISDAPSHLVPHFLSGGHIRWKSPLVDTRLPSAPIFRRMPIMRALVADVAWAAIATHGKVMLRVETLIAIMRMFILLTMMMLLRTMIM